MAKSKVFTRICDANCEQLVKNITDDFDSVTTGLVAYRIFDEKLATR